MYGMLMPTFVCISRTSALHDTHSVTRKDEKQSGGREKETRL